MFELSILFMLALAGGAALFVAFVVAVALKLTFGLLKWILLPVLALLGLILLVTVGPVLLAVGAAVVAALLPLLVIGGLMALVWAGAHLVLLV